MPWNESSAMLERMKFIVAVSSGELSFSDQCQRFGISRKTGYKWLERFDQGGLEDLKDRSRAPRSSPQRIDAGMAERILELKYRYPTWGPKKLLGKLESTFPPQAWPASSTIGELLKQHGLVKPRKRSQRVPANSTPLSHCQRANDVWSADFKGQIQLGNGQWLYPFTVSDNYSRYLFTCKGMLSTTEYQVKQEFERLFRDKGLPEAIRTDNGSPFASRALGGLSRLSVWLIKLGIRPERIARGKPQQNGRHERMHRTLNQDAIEPVSANVAIQQERFDRFLTVYNDERPHEALGNKTPSSVYKKSQRVMPTKLPKMEYQDGWDVRQVRGTGEIKWQGQLVFVSAALQGEPIGLQRVDEDRWQIHFGVYPLGLLDARRGKVIRPA